MTQAAYQVGYGRPPQHTRFQKGQSGNPGGKPGPKKLLKRDFDRALCKALDADEKTFRAARPVRIVEIAARRTVIQALDGKLPALRLILSVLEKGDCDLSFEEREDERGEGAINSLSQGKSQGFSEKDEGAYGAHHSVSSPAHGVPSPASVPRAGEVASPKGEPEGATTVTSALPPPTRAVARATSPAPLCYAGEGARWAGEESVRKNSLLQGNSQGFSKKNGAPDGDKDEAFEKLYEAGHAAGRLDHLFDPSLDNSVEAFQKRFNAACDAGLLDDFLALYDTPIHSLPQGNSQAIPQNGGHAGEVIAR